MCDITNQTHSDGKIKPTKRTLFGVCTSGGGVAVMWGSEGGGGKGGDEVMRVMVWGDVVVGRDCGDDVGAMEVTRWSGEVDEERWLCDSEGDDGLSDAWPATGGRKNGRKEEEALENFGEGGDSVF
nr:hypothetical protein [Tanacetum cinerariifolium]